MQVKDIIKIHDQLWSKPSRSFQSIRCENLRFVTQNMTKLSRNTDWIKGDPDNRRLTWVFSSTGYKGLVREYMLKGEHIIEVHSLNPDRLLFKQVRNLVAA